MRCSGCPYRYHPFSEYSYTSCRVFGDDTPEQYARKDGEGCICNRKTLAKLFKENEEAWMKEAASFVEWYKENKDGNVD
jgi:hypothetical protein